MPHQQLLHPIANELGLDIEKEDDLVSLAQFYVNEQGNNKHEISEIILNEFSKVKETTENHRLLSKLPITTYWTTNYDQLIEQALREEGKVVDVKSEVSQLSITRARRDAVVYKMHGDVFRPQEAIITKDEYEKYFRTHGAFINALTGDLVSKTFLFVGLSFQDPNLEYVLSRIRVTFETNQRTHFAFFKTISKNDGQSNDDFRQLEIRQKLFIQDLRRFGIQALLVDDFEEITEALEVVESTYREQTIFISASASRFEPWGESQVSSFMRQLGKELVSSNLRIATGVGLGVGNAVISGGLESVFEGNRGHIEDSLLMRPFPQSHSDSSKLPQIWKSYRSNLISHAGIALFLFGNKLVDGEVVNADGVKKEFEIAKEAGLLLLPIGATGSMAKKLADMALGNPDIYCPRLSKPAQSKLASLSDPVEQLDLLIPKIIDLVETARIDG